MKTSSRGQHWSRLQTTIRVRSKVQKKEEIQLQLSVGRMKSLESFQKVSSSRKCRDRPVQSASTLLWKLRKTVLSIFILMLLYWDNKAHFLMISDDFMLILEKTRGWFTNINFYKSIHNFCKFDILLLKQHYIQQKVPYHFFRTQKFFILLHRIDTLPMA